jgi:predicted RNA polymerase sigma factor
MITSARRQAKQATLSRAFKSRIKQTTPVGVSSWVMQHARLSDADSRRLKKLYDKAMDETITEVEKSELDYLMDASAAMDLLRARLMYVSGLQPSRGMVKK